MPLVRVLTVMGEVAPVVDCVVPPSLESHVTVNAVTASPPSEPAMNSTVTALRFRSTEVIVGASARPTATKGAESADAALSPIVFVATAAHVYVLPLDNDPTVIGDVVSDADCGSPPSLEVHVTVKPVTVSPPLAFAVNPTVAEFDPRSTVVRLGASGTVATTKELDAVDAALSPKVFVATAVQV